MDISHLGRSIALLRQAQAMVRLAEDNANLGTEITYISFQGAVATIEGEITKLKAAVDKEMDAKEKL
jgi:hypothetical protein